jgi:DNA primase
MEADYLSIRTLSKLVSARLNYHLFYLRYLPGAKVVNSRIHTACPIPSHQHTGKGTRALSVDLKRGLFHCFSRDEGGDAFRFYELIHETDFVQAVRSLAVEVGVSFNANDSTVMDGLTRDLEAIVVAEPSRNSDFVNLFEIFLGLCRKEDQSEGFNYLFCRGINRETIEAARVAYFPRSSYRTVMQKLAAISTLDQLQASGLFNEGGRLTFYRHRLLFPFMLDGRVVYLQARATERDVAHRWHNLRGAVPALYNVDILSELSSGSTVYLVEGFTDTLTLMANNFMAVGIVGAGGFREEWLPVLGRFRVVTVLDGDQAGQNAANRYQALFASRGIRLARIKLQGDVNDFFCNNPTAPVEFALLTEAAIEAAGWPIDPIQAESDPAFAEDSRIIQQCLAENSRLSSIAYRE